MRRSHTAHRSTLKIEKLEADGNERHQHAKNLAEAAVGKPSLHPCLDGMRVRKMFISA